MAQLVQVYTDIYKPAFDENKDEYTDKSPYKPYERNCIRFECRCKAGAYFIGNSQFKQHIKSKTHKDFIVNYKKYFKEIDELGEKNKTLLSENQLLERKNNSQNDKIEDLINKIDKLQKQNKDLLKIIADMNDDDDDYEFEDCL
jgi:hypothetical protein